MINKYRMHINALKIKVEQMTKELRRIQEDVMYTPLAKDEAKRRYINQQEELVQLIDLAKSELQKKIVLKTQDLKPKELSKLDKEQLMFDYKFKETVKGEKLSDTEVLEIWSNFMDKDLSNLWDVLPPPQRELVKHKYNLDNKVYFDAVADVDAINKISSDTYISINNQGEFEITEPYMLNVIDTKYTTEI